jgi:hypothetical protein
MAKEILLDAGTNEMELLVFRLGPTPFGVNVARCARLSSGQYDRDSPCAPGGRGQFSCAMRC